MIRSSLVQDVESSKFPGIKGSALEKGTPLAPSTFFDFPAVTDDRVIRLVGLQVGPPLVYSRARAVKGYVCFHALNSSSA